MKWTMFPGGWEKAVFSPASGCLLLAWFISVVIEAKGSSQLEVLALFVITAPFLVLFWLLWFFLKSIWRFLNRLIP